MNVSAVSKHEFDDTYEKLQWPMRISLSDRELADEEPQSAPRMIRKPLPSGLLQKFMYVLETNESEGVSQTAGESVSLESAAHVRHQTALKSLLHRFASLGFPVGQKNEAVCISPTTLLASQRILDCLSLEYELPKIEPEGDGGLTMEWVSGDRATVLTVEGLVLHLVHAPARDASDYFDDIPFNGETLPYPIENEIPKRAR